MKRKFPWTIKEEIDREVGTRKREIERFSNTNESEIIILLKVKVLKVKLLLFIMKTKY